MFLHLQFSVSLFVPLVLSFHLPFSSASCPDLPYNLSCQALVEQAKSLCFLNGYHFKSIAMRNSNKFGNYVVKAPSFIFYVSLFPFFLSFSQVVTRSFNFLITLLSSRTEILARLQCAKSSGIICVPASCFVSLVNFSRWKYTARTSCTDGYFEPVNSSFTDPTKWNSDFLLFSAGIKIKP